MAVKVGGAYVELGLELKEFEKGLAQAEAGLVSLGNGMRDIGVAMSVAFTAPLTAFLNTSYQAFDKFQTAMNATGSLIDNVSKESMKSLSDLAISLGSTTKFSALEAADAMKELAAAGYQTQTIMSALPGVINLAAAGGINLAEATNIAVGVMGGFNIPASKMEYAASLIAKAANVSAISITDLGYTFKYIAPIAKGVGLSFEEISGAAAIMGNSFIRAEQAGTSLRGIVARLVDPSRENAEAFKRLGLQIFDATGKMNSLADIIGQFEKKGLQARDIIKLFGQEAGVGMVALLNKGSDALVKMTNTMANAGNEAERVAKERLRGFSGELMLLRSNLSTFAVEAFAPLEKYGIMVTDAFGAILSAGRSLVKGFSELPPAVQDIVVVFTALVGVVGPAMALFGQFASFLGTSAIFSTAAQGAQAMLGGFATLVTTLKGLPTILATIGEAMSLGMTGALVGVEALVFTLGQVALAAGAAYAAFQYFKDLGPVFTQMNEDAGFAADTIANELGNAFSALAESTAATETNIAGASNSLEGYVDASKTATAATNVLHTAWAAFVEFLEYATGFRTIKDTIILVGELIGTIGAQAKAIAYIATDVGNSLDRMRKKALEAKTSVENIWGVNAGLQTEGRGKFIAATEELAKKLQEQGKVVLKAKMTWDEYRKALDDLDKPVTAVSKNFDYLYAKQKKTSAATKENQKFVDDLSDSMLRQYRTLNKLNDDLLTENGMAKAVAKGGKEVFDQINTINKRLEELRIKPQLDINGYSKDLEKIRDKTIALFGVEQKKYMETVWAGVTPLMENYMAGLDKVNLKSETTKQITEGIWKNFTGLGDAYKKQLELLEPFGIKTLYQIDTSFERVKEMKKVIDTMYQKGEISQEQYFQAQLKYLQEARTYAVAHGQDYRAIDREIGNVTNNIKRMGGEVKRTYGDLDPLIRQISSIVDDLGRGITDAILSGKNLGSVFIDVLANMGKAIMRFTIEFMINGFIKSVRDGTNAFANLGSSIEGVFDKFKSMFTRGGSTVPTGLPSTTGGSNPGPNIPGASAGASSGWGFNPGSLSAITGIVDSIFGGLSFFQGRRQEQDIGRIEVTSRGMLNQLISIQDTMNQYYPYFINLKFLQNLNITMQQLGDMISGSVDTLTTKGITVTGGTSTSEMAAGVPGVRGSRAWNAAYQQEMQKQTQVYNALNQALGGSGVSDFFNLSAQKSQSSRFGEDLQQATESVLADTSKQMREDGQRTLEDVLARRNPQSRLGSYGLGAGNEALLKQMALEGKSIQQMSAAIDWLAIDLKTPLKGFESNNNRLLALLEAENYMASVNKTGKTYSLGADGNIYDQTGKIHLDLTKGQLEVNAELKTQAQKDTYAKSLLAYIEQQQLLGKSWEEMTVQEKKNAIEVNVLTKLQDDANKEHIANLQELGAELGYTVDEYGKVVRFVPVISTEFKNMSQGFATFSASTTSFGAALGQSAAEIAAYQKMISENYFKPTNSGSMSGGSLTVSSFLGSSAPGVVPTYDPNKNASFSGGSLLVNGRPYDPNQYNYTMPLNQLNSQLVQDTMAPQPLQINVYANNSTDGRRVANEFVKSLADKGIYF